MVYYAKAINVTDHDEYTNLSTAIFPGNILIGFFLYSTIQESKMYCGR
jgi:hypothetical protein